MGQKPPDLIGFQPERTFGGECLLVAIDETGHEELADPRYPVFGLGGCLTVVKEYEAQVRKPWMKLKQTHFSGDRAPLHASNLRPTRTQAAAIGQFFRDSTFGRFAVVTTLDTSLGTPMSRYESTALLMARLMSDAASAYEFEEVAVIFEHSERTDPLVRRVFSPNNGPTAPARWRVPTSFFYASKDLAEPLVEVADFVMQASGAAVLAHLRTGAPPLNRRDFASVFEGGLSRRAAFLRLDVIEPAT